MSGYIGNPDAEAEHALILSENGIKASQMQIEGTVLENCLDCAEEIDPRRRAFAISKSMKCHYCISCQSNHDSVQKVRMLDRIL